MTQSNHREDTMKRFLQASLGAILSSHDVHDRPCEDMTISMGTMSWRI